MNLQEEQQPKAKSSIIVTLPSTNCNPHQGFPMIESCSLDSSNRRMNNRFRGISRGFFTIEIIIHVCSRGTVRDVLRWHVSTQFESIIPTCIFISPPRNCEDCPVHREPVCMAPNHRQFSLGRLPYLPHVDCYYCYCYFQ